MIKLPKEETKALVAVHGWSAIVLGFLLYAVVLTGTIAVFAHEIGHWSIGKADKPSIYNSPIDAPVRTALAGIDAEYHDEVMLLESPAGHVYVWAHTHKNKGGPQGPLRDYGVLLELDRMTGVEVSRKTGWGGDVFVNPAAALEQFIVQAHVQLYVPNPWGLILTGILGLTMLVAAVSGVLMHRHLIKDIFTLRRKKATLVAARDEHSVASTWGLPFAFLLAFTGTFFSFALSLGLPILAMVAFGGDQAKLIQTVLGTPRAEDARPATTANLDTILSDARTRTGGSEVNGLVVGHYGRKDASVTVRMAPPEGELQVKALVYNGATGAFVKDKPPVGQEPSMGATLVAIIGPLHFGNFGGVLSKSVWLALGFSSCFMIATGMSLWLKRREGQPGWATFGIVNAVATYGIPISLAGSAFAFLLAYPGDGTLHAPPLGFVIAAFVLLLYGGLVRHEKRLNVHLMGLLGLCLLLLPAFRMAIGGIGWGQAMALGAADTVGVDLVLLVGGVVCLWLARKWAIQLVEAGELVFDYAMPSAEFAGSRLRRVRTGGTTMAGEPSRAQTETGRTEQFVEPAE